MILCPRCQSERIKPSHSRNLEERVAKWSGRRAYRCIHCGWRGILKSDQGNIIRRAMGKAKFKPIQVVIVITVTLLAVAAILYWLIHEPEKPMDIEPVAGLITLMHIKKLKKLHKHESE